MGGCEPGHEWRPESETVSFIRFRCADCGSVCVAPKPVDQLCLEVRRTSRPRRTPAAPRRRAEAPRWATSAASSAAAG
jgi:hypothetical protein